VSDMVDKEKLDEMHATIISMAPRMENTEVMVNRLDKIITGQDDPSSGLFFQHQESKARLKALEGSQAKRDKLTTAAATTGAGAIVAWMINLFRSGG